MTTKTKADDVTPDQTGWILPPEKPDDRTALRDVLHCTLSSVREYLLPCFTADTTGMDRSKAAAALAQGRREMEAAIEGFRKHEGFSTDDALDAAIQSGIIKLSYMCDFFQAEVDAEKISITIDVQKREKLQAFMREHNPDNLDVEFTLTYLQNKRDGGRAKKGPQANALNWLKYHLNELAPGVEGEPNILSHLKNEWGIEATQRVFEG